MTPSLQFGHSMSLTIVATTFLQSLFFSPFPSVDISLVDSLHSSSWSVVVVVVVVELLNIVKSGMISDTIN